MFFPGMELAGILKDKAKSVAIVDQSETPLHEALGAEIATSLQKVRNPPYSNK